MSYNNLSDYPQIFLNRNVTIFHCSTGCDAINLWNMAHHGKSMALETLIGTTLEMEL
ncbi:MAG: hypothetical protein OSB68_02845 [Dehalococcoidia bacterium]|nr:hypothetical protein [Dehalococcoidia bacterium]